MQNIFSRNISFALDIPICPFRNNLKLLIFLILKIKKIISQPSLYLNINNNNISKQSLSRKLNKKTKKDIYNFLFNNNNNKFIILN